MKLTKSQLKQIIKEELASQVNKINETHSAWKVACKDFRPNHP